MPIRSAAIRLPLVAIAAVAAACSTDAGRTGAGDVGGTMVLISAASGDALLPSLAADQTARQVTDVLYEPLAEIGDSLNTYGDAGFQPRLARSWAWARDSMSIAFQLDPRARWHDGRPVRANDVRFSLDLIKDPKTASPNAVNLANVDSITVRDSLTAVAWFQRKTPEQFYDLAYGLRILPEHVLRDVPREQLRTSEVVRRPVGSGRFRFVRFDPGVRIEVVADTAHYRERARLDRIVWSFASDGNAALTQLFSGQGDYYETLPPDLLPRVDSSAHLKTVRYAGMQYAYVGFNTRDPRRLAAPHPIFQDVRVRRALSMAVDREAMLRNVFDTLGVLGSGPHPLVFADPAIQPPPFDRARAGQLLDSAGWLMPAGRDSVRAKGGRPLAFTIIVPNSSRPRMRYAVLLQEQLRAVGARVTIDAMGFREFLERQNTGNFDAATMVVGVDPTPATIRQAWATSGIGAGQNYVRYSNPAFDALVDSARNSFDRNRARDYYRRAYRTIVEDAPAIWLYDPLFMAGAHKRIRPAGMRGDAWWVGLPDFWIPADERIERDRIGLRPAQP